MWPFKSEPHSVEKKGQKMEDVFWRIMDDQLNNETITKPYKQSLWVHVGVRIIATNAGQVPFKFYKGETELVDDPLVKLFDFVNPFMSSSQLWEATASYLYLKGNCIWLLERSVGQDSGIPGSLPSAIYPYDDSCFRYVLDPKTRRITSWVFRGAGQEIPLTLDEVIHFKFFNPYDNYMGMTPIEAIRLSMESDYEAQKTNRAIFKNGLGLDAMLIFDKLTEVDQKRIEKEMSEDFKGSANSHGIKILSGSPKFIPTTMKPKDAEYIEQRKMSREEILSVLGVPKAVGGLYEDINYATALAAKKIFWNDTMTSLLSLLQTKVQTDFVDKRRGGSNIKCRFDLSKVPEMQEDLTDKINSAKVLYEMGVPFSDINDRLSLGFDTDNMPGANEPRPINVSPLALDYEDEDKNIAIKIEKKTEHILKGNLSKLNTIEERLKFWANMQESVSLFESRFRSMFKRIWEEMQVNNLERINSNLKKYEYSGWSKNKILQSLTKLKMDDVIFDYALFKKEFKTASKPIIIQGVNDGGARALATVDLSIAFDVTDPYTLKWAEKQSLKLAASLCDTAKEEVREIIKDGLIEGRATGEIAKEIESYYTTSEKWKATRLARTETQSALNHGASEGYRQSGVVEAKEWVASPDSCETCSDNDGREFSLDNEDIPKHPNCMCCWAPIVKEED